MMHLGKADLLIIETLKSDSKKSLTLHSTKFWVPFDFKKYQLYQRYKRLQMIPVSEC